MCSILRRRPHENKGKIGRRNEQVNSVRGVRRKTRAWLVIVGVAAFAGVCSVEVYVLLHRRVTHVVPRDAQTLLHDDRAYVYVPRDATRSARDGLCDSGDFSERTWLYTRVDKTANVRADYEGDLRGSGWREASRHTFTRTLEQRRFELHVSGADDRNFVVVDAGVSPANAMLVRC
jgi:hypothetical protein